MLRVRLTEDDILIRVLAGFSTDPAGEMAGDEKSSFFFKGEAGGVNGDLKSKPSLQWDQGFKLNLGKSSEMNMWLLFFTIFNRKVSRIIWMAPYPKPNHHSQVELVQISDKHWIYQRFWACDTRKFELILTILWQLLLTKVTGRKKTCLKCFTLVRAYYFNYLRRLWHNLWTTPN